MIRHHLKLKYEKSIVENQNVIFNEIQKVFSTYTYTSKSRKLKKHFPIVYGISYDRLITKYKKVSCSLLSNKIENQITEFMNTAERRMNWTQILGSNIELLLIYNKLGINSPLPSMYSHQIVKYNKKKIDIHFPELKDTNFDVMYKIYNENCHLYADISSDTLCNFILLCCVYSTKMYHIFFYFDKEHIIYPLELYKNKEYIKDKFINPI
jgi:hypothetical protein